MDSKLAKYTPQHTKCSKCGKEIPVYFPENTLFVTCKSCKTYNKYDVRLNATSEDALFKYSIIPELSIGTLFNYDNTELVLVGCAKGSLKGVFDVWMEYYFYSPKTKQNIILTTSNDEWLVLKEIENEYEKPAKRNQTLFFNNHSCRIKSVYKSVYIAALGEVSFDLTSDEGFSVIEYEINKHQILVKENETWFLGNKLNPKSLAQKFPNNEFKVLQKRAETVSMFHPKLGFGLFKVAAFFSFVLILVSLFSGLFKSNNQIFNENISFVLDSQGESNEIVTSSFEVKDGYIENNILDYELYANVHNTWLETSVTLINETSGKEYYFDTGVEYYQGSGWSEGSLSKVFELESMPAGRYRMILKIYGLPSIEQNVTQGTSYPYTTGYNPSECLITIKEVAFSMSNFWLTLALIWVFPLLFLIVNNEN